MKYEAGPKTIAAAKDAIQCQDACNMSGVVHSMSRHMTAIREEQPMGTDDLNRHPVVVLFADKIASLANVQNLGNSAFADAMDGCRALSEGKSFEPIKDRQPIA